MVIPLYFLSMFSFPFTDMHKQFKSHNNNITDEQLLDEEITIIPSTLSPGTFSTQVSQRLGIRSLSKRIADAVRPNETNHAR